MTFDGMSMRQIMDLLPRDSELPRMLRRHGIGISGNYEKFVEMLYEDLDVCVRELQKSPEMRQKDSEDRLTEDINVQLRRMNYDATHDTSSGGHVDITVKLGTLTWVGEAKKDQKFIEGMRQLTTRYRPASGNPNHNASGLIFYLVKTGGDVAGKLKVWRDTMRDQTLPGYSERDCPANPFAFYSRHIAEWSGLPVEIRHVMVGLHHQPKDKSGRETAQRAAKKEAAKSTPASRKRAPRKAASPPKKGPKTSGQNLKATQTIVGKRSA